MNPILQSIAQTAVEATGADQGWIFAVDGHNLIGYVACRRRCEEIHGGGDVDSIAHRNRDDQRTG